MENLVFFIELVGKTMLNEEHRHVVCQNGKSGQVICQRGIIGRLVISQAVCFLVTLVAVLIGQVLPIAVIVKRVSGVYTVGKLVRLRWQDAEKAAAYRRTGIIHAFAFGNTILEFEHIKKNIIIGIAFGGANQKWRTGAVSRHNQVIL